MMREILRHARNRFRAFVDEASRIEGLQFPYAHSEQAVRAIRTQARHILDYLESLGPSSNHEAVKTFVAESLRFLHESVPLLGFVIRSTGASNSFEAYGPLLRLARSLLDEKARLIISSEWDYSPFVYLYPKLPDFILLGLPASEAENPLLLPLAGHEFGHALWKRLKLQDHFSPVFQDKIVSQIKQRWEEYQKFNPSLQQGDLDQKAGRETWNMALLFALAQAEETFCDVVGLRIFAKSYLEAFSYAISPRTGAQRPLTYPNTKTRAQSLADAAAHLSYDIGQNFCELFEDDPEPYDEETKLLLSLADEASRSVLEQLVITVSTAADNAGIPEIDKENATRIYEDFKQVVPASHPRALVDVLNSGWMCYHDDSLWKNCTHIKRDDCSRILRDLVLKSIEVLEVQEMLKE